MQRRYQKCKHLPSARANEHTHSTIMKLLVAVQLCPAHTEHCTVHIYIRFFVCWTYARERTVPGFPLFFFFPTVCIFTSEFLFSHSISYSAFLRQNYFHQFNSKCSTDFCGNLIKIFDLSFSVKCTVAPEVSHKIHFEILFTHRKLWL